LNRFDEIRRLFAAAMDLATDERRRFLDRECGDDLELRNEIEDLLRRDRAADEIFETASLELQQARHVTEAAALLKDPEVIGPYRILERLGQGGMGLVYLAQQDEPVRRQVAIKVIRLGMHTDQVIARFLAERQALALLDHDGIARLLDAGADENGRPYFVMELVAGESLTRYADAQRLPLRRRLELLARVCDVVQYAHQRGVLHRDLKPANILVRSVTGQPAVKIIDFGIARIMDDDQRGATLMTTEGQFVGTPEYMSPEQLDPAGVVDTRSDVFALGVVLFELVTGRPPRRLTSMSPVALGEFAQEFTRADQPSPGRQLARLTDDERTDVGEHRGTTWARLSRTVRGDLDWIALKATAPEPERRYGSAAALADDLRAFLQDRPVTAAPPGTRYRVGKFVRRHRAAVLGASLLVLSLLVGTATTAWQAVRATRQVERLERYQEFLEDGFLRAPTPSGFGRDLKVSELLDQATDDASRRFADDPPTLAAVQHTLGLTYRDLGLLEPSATLLRSASRLWLEQGREEELLGTREQLALTLIDQEQNEEAIDIMTDVVDQLRRRHGSLAPVTLAAQTVLAESYPDDRFAEAESLLTSTLAAQEAILGRESDDVLATLGALAVAVGFHSDGRLRADTLLARAEGLAARLHGPDHMITLGIEANRAGNLLNEGHRLDEALALMESVYPRFESVWGERHLETLTLRSHRAAAYHQLGMADRADRELRTLIDLSAESLGRGHPLHHNCLFSLAVSEVVRGRWASADSLTAMTMDLIETHQPERRDLLAFMAGRRSQISQRLGRDDEAAAYFEQGFEGLQEIYGELAWYPQQLMRHRCSYLIDAGRFQEAEDLLLESKEAMIRHHGAFDGSAQFTVYKLEELWLVQRRFAAVESMLLEYEQALAEADREPAVLLEIRRHLLWFYEDIGDEAAAASYRTLVGDSPRTVPLKRF